MNVRTYLVQNTQRKQMYTKHPQSARTFKRSGLQSAIGTIQNSNYIIYVCSTCLFLQTTDQSQLNLFCSSRTGWEEGDVLGNKWPKTLGSVCLR